MSADIWLYILNLRTKQKKPPKIPENKNKTKQSRQTFAVNKYWSYFRKKLQNF